MRKPNKNKPFAKKSFGQNFLVDQNFIDKIIKAVNPQIGETIVEIGAGRGALTEKLINSGANIVAVELDRDLIPDLKEKFGEFKNFQLIENDALKIDFSQIKSAAKLKLAANLPYYISTAILQKLIEQRENFSEMILMFQKEVVERITAETGNKERGFLTILVEAYLQAEKLFDVPPNAFRPSPKVQSAVVRLITKSKVEITIKNEKIFREIVSLGFSRKRKTIQNNLKEANSDLLELFDKKGNLGKILEKVEINPARRAETLTIDEWVKLENYLSE